MIEARRARAAVLLPAVLTVAVLGAQACVDLGPYSQIQASCPEGVATAQMWEEASDGELRPLDPVACDVVEAATAQYGTQWQAACGYARTTLCAALVGDADASAPDTEQEVGTPDADGGPGDVTTDGATEVLEDVTTDTPTADLPQPDADAVTAPDGDAVSTPDGDAVSTPDGDGQTTDMETETEIDAGPQNTPPALAAPDPQFGDIVISGADPAFEGLVSAGGALSLNFVASDDDAGDEVTVTVEPTGGTLTPDAAGFSGQQWPVSNVGNVLLSNVGSGTPGTVEFTVTADDGNGGTDQYTLLLTLNVPPIVPLPVFAPGQVVKGSYPNFVVNMERGDSFSFSYTATDADINDELTITTNVTGGTIAANSGISESLPLVSMSTSPAMGSLSGTPTANGTLEVTVVVSDSHGEGESFTILFIVGGPGFDFNGDGYDDMAFTRCAGGLDDYAAVNVMLGKPTLPNGDFEALAVDLNINSVILEDGFGSTVVNAGDVNGDGYDDMAVAAPFTDGAANLTGAVYIFFGSADPQVSGSPGAGLIITGHAENMTIGYRLAAGDINGDGFADLLVSEGLGAGTGVDQHVFLFYGGPTLPQTFQTDQADVTFGPSGSLGDSIVVGNLNGDAYDDVALFDGNSQSVFVFNGGPSLASTLAVGSASTVVTGASVSVGGSGSSGDVNGDSTDDLVMKAGGTGGAQARVLEGGTWAASVDPETLAAIQADGLDPGFFDARSDVDGDGSDDFVLSAMEQQERLVLVVPGWTQTPGTPVLLTDASVHRVSLGTSGVEVSSARGVGDLNGDGNEEFAFVYGPSAFPTNLAVFVGGPWSVDLTLVNAATNLSDSSNNSVCRLGWH